MNIDKLKQQTLKLLAMRADRGTNFEQIRRVVVKDELTEEDIAQLEHFVHTPKRQLDETTYWANTIIEPNSWERRTYRWSTVDSEWKELHSKAKIANEDK